MKTQLLLAAGGMGTRLGLGGPKALVAVAGRPLIVHTLQRFAPLGLVDDAVVVIPAGFEHDFQEVLERAFPNARFSLVQGGPERQISVENGLAKLAPDTEIVVIHDAARPFVAQESIIASMEAARADGAATVAIPSIDTILQGDESAYLVDTPDRSALWACQTPQTFQLSVIRTAHQAARNGNFLGTDDASLVRRTGGRVKLVNGTPLNFKVTTPTDLALAECVVKEGLI